MSNRIIKFRAWDKNNKYMWPVAAISFTRNEVMYHAGQPKLGGTVVKTNDCVLMQYTGLKDKNGKDIWEGDILRTGWGGLGDVRYDVKSGGYRIFAGELSWKLSRFSLKEYKYEVIGNVWEHPNLLKETKP